MNKDLFGNEIHYPESKVGGYIKNKDELTFSARVARLEYLHKLNPDGLSLAGNMELVLSYRELQEVYINGHYLSVILLGQSWIEKNLHIYLEKIGLKNITKKGSAAMIQHCIDNNLINGVLSKKMDKFRLIRNPIAHIKSENYEYNLGVRSSLSKNNPFVQLEKDAKEVIEISTHIARYGLE
jgi:hypothetical protein